MNVAITWTAFGYLEYRIPMDPLFVGRHITTIKINMELAAYHAAANGQRSGCRIAQLNDIYRNNFLH